MTVVIYRYYVCSILVQINNINAFDFLCEENKDLIVIGTFYLNGALLS
jgi:hypothetical protein